MNYSFFEKNNNATNVRYWNAKYFLQNFMLEMLKLQINLWKNPILAICLSFVYVI